MLIKYSLCFLILASILSTAALADGLELNPNASFTETFSVRASIDDNTICALIAPDRARNKAMRSCLQAGYEKCQEVLNTLLVDQRSRYSCYAEAESIVQGKN